MKRSTKQRTAVASALSASTDFVSAQQLHISLGSDAPALATVYRTLQSLVDEGTADTVSRGGEQVYRACGPAHHHHLVCTECAATVEVDVVSPNADVAISLETNVSLLGNIWVSGTAGSLTRDETDTTANYIDAGGNFSTTNESAFLDDPSSSSNVAESALDLSEPADNGGPTWTAALGADSVGIDAVRPSVASALLGFAFDVDQRGDDRVGNIDAGAFEFGELADTGVDATGIALTGGVLGAAGVALVARRRRKA